MARAHRAHGRQGARQADRAGQVAAAGGAADQAHLRADQLPGAYRRDGEGVAAAGLADRPSPVAEHPRSGHVPESQFRPGRPVGRHSDAFPRPAQRPRGRAGHGDRQDRQRHSAVEGARLCRLLCARSRHDRARPRGPQLPQIGRRLCGARPLDGDRRRDCRIRTTCRSASPSTARRSRTAIPAS